MNRRLTFAIFVLSVAAPVTAAALPCSTRPASDTSASALPGLAKVTMADARKAALASLKKPSARVVTEDLEIEDGCLVYSFDVKIPGRSGVEEVFVDAGTGKVLLRKHETPKQEAAERVKP
jgi:hypothetical protein